ncbi:MAG: 4Fe-4S binding protein [Lachnospiraceae bacterium]|nr:4Fe-4S binding protein [Lachnospiraceae bacterium]
MAYVREEDCISCGACESICPMSAITVGDGAAYVNSAECIDCGQCVDICPVEAIEEE